MYLTIEEIQNIISEDIVDFESKFRNSMKTKVLLLDRIMTYIVKRKGKQIRPMFVFLTARMIGQAGDTTHRGAALIELLHTATLVHDDVVDDSSRRRGFFSINALWKNKIAVLVGDYLLSRGLLLSIENNDFELLKIVSQAVKEMSEGELLQMEKARNLDITEEVYFEIIRQKTASLIASCCGVGAASVGASAEDIAKVKLFGEKVGLAFQIKDDLFDYSTEDIIGKPVGIDIKERKLTLPLIYTLNRVSWLEKRRMINIVKNDNENSVKVKELINLVKVNGGIDYANSVMMRLVEEAQLLLKTFPDSKYKNALLSLVQYTIERKK
ncbi:MAG: polyprenyl synthetase family protein [Cytophagales bacterium]|nr:MAG: polyprenyl synthetase family protein [Cytophagales bacterium]